MPIQAWRTHAPTMTLLLLNNDHIQQVLTAPMTLAALEVAYRELIEREAVCRPAIGAIH